MIYILVLWMLMVGVMLSIIWRRLPSDTESKGCYMCDNARINKELTEDTDFSAVTIGDCDDNFRMMYCSGGNKPPGIEIEKWDDKTGYHFVGVYYPNYCPNCGRKITEYE